MDHVAVIVACVFVSVVAGACAVAAAGLIVAGLVALAISVHRMMIEWGSP